MNKIFSTTIIIFISFLLFGGDAAFACRIAPLSLANVTQCAFYGGGGISGFYSCAALEQMYPGATSCTTEISYGCDYPPFGTLDSVVTMNLDCDNTIPPSVSGGGGGGSGSGGGGGGSGGSGGPGGCESACCAGGGGGGGGAAEGVVATVVALQTFTVPLYSRDPKLLGKTFR